MTIHVRYAVWRAPKAGVDGTDGEHPRRTTVRNCSGREIGLYEKQSSFFVQAKTAESRILSNVFFNGLLSERHSDQLSCFVRRLEAAALVESRPMAKPLTERPEIKYDFLEWGGKRMRDSGLSRVWSIVPATQRGPRYSQRSCVQA